MTHMTDSSRCSLTREPPSRVTSVIAQARAVRVVFIASRSRTSITVARERTAYEGSGKKRVVTLSGIEL